MSAGGRTVTAPGTMATQTGGSVIEFIYRAYIPGNFNQVCITNLRGCDDATSMALYVERNSENSASALIQFDREFHEDGCTSRTVLLDDSPESRNFDILVPIHEKSDDGREVRVLVQARNGSNVLTCLLYTSPSPRDQRGSRMPSSA